MTLFGDRLSSFEATPVGNVSSVLDLAVLEVRAPSGVSLPQAAAISNFRKEGGPNQGERVWRIDSDYRVVPNSVVKLDHDYDTRHFEFTNASIGDGVSGGPVLDESGRLVGIHWGTASGGRYAVAMKIGSALDLLQAIGYRLETARIEASPPKPSSARPGEVRVHAVVNYVWAPPGEFQMGCSPGDTQCYSGRIRSAFGANRQGILDEANRSNAC